AILAPVPLAGRFPLSSWRSAWPRLQKKEKISPIQSYTPQKHYLDSSIGLQLLLKGTQFFPRCFECISLANQQSHQTRQAQPRKVKHFAHRWIKPGARENNGLRMLRPPPPDRTVDQRHIEKGENAEKSAD